MPITIKKPILKLYDIIEVIWIDSHSASGWKVPSDIEKFIVGAQNDFTIKTMGYFFHEDKDFIRVCQSHDGQSKDINGSGKDSLDALFAIAKPCIKEIKVIKRR